MIYIFHWFLWSMYLLVLKMTTQIVMSLYNVTMGQPHVFVHCKVEGALEFVKWELNLKTVIK